MGVTSTPAFRFVALAATTSVLLSIATLYLREEPIVLVLDSATVDTSSAESISFRSLKSVDLAEAEKHFKKARKVINSWQAGNLAMGNELYKVRMVPGPRGPAGPADEKFKDTKPGTAKASKALVVDSNKDISGIRNIEVSGALTTGGSLTVTSGTNSGSGWGINDNARGSNGADAIVTADATISNANSNGKWHQLGQASADLTLTFPKASTGIYYFYATAATSKAITLRCDTLADTHTVLSGTNGAAQVTGEPAKIVSPGLGIGDTMTVVCNGNVGCYASIISGTRASGDLEYACPVDTTADALDRLSSSNTYYFNTATTADTNNPDGVCYQFIPGTSLKRDETATHTGSDCSTVFGTGTVIDFGTLTATSASQLDFNTDGTTDASACDDATDNRYVAVVTGAVADSASEVTATSITQGTDASAAECTFTIVLSIPPLDACY